MADSPKLHIATRNSHRRIQDRRIITACNRLTRAENVWGTHTMPKQGQRRLCRKCENVTGGL